jgi:hypothetical protein
MAQWSWSWSCRPLPTCVSVGSNFISISIHKHSLATGKQLTGTTAQWHYGSHRCSIGGAWGGGRWGRAVARNRSPDAWRPKHRRGRAAELRTMAVRREGELSRARAMQRLDGERRRIRMLVLCPFAVCCLG